MAATGVTGLRIDDFAGSTSDSNHHKNRAIQLGNISHFLQDGSLGMNGPIVITTTLGSRAHHIGCDSHNFSTFDNGSDMYFSQPMFHTNARNRYLLLDQLHDRLLAQLHGCSGVVSDACLFRIIIQSFNFYILESQGISLYIQ